jgi:hypothetical protein
MLTKCVAVVKVNLGKLIMIQQCGSMCCDDDSKFMCEIHINALALIKV